MTSTRFPDSEISGSTPVCGSPKLFAANHVLHRLLTPRHSPCALSSLATNLMQNPERVPHLRRSLRWAKPTFARVRVLEAFLRRLAQHIETDAAVPGRPKSAQLELGAHHY